MPPSPHHPGPYTGIETIEAWEIDPRAGDLRIRIGRDRPPPPTAAMTAEWERMVAHSPRLHDSPLLSVVSFDPDCNEVATRRDGYARLAVQPRVATGVRQLSVTAILSAHEGGRNGRQYVLLGRRSHHTRIYGGQWELGPSGGLPAPPLNIDSMDLADISRHLADEIAEEAGLTVPDRGVPVAYIRDHTAHSDDIVLRFSLGELADIAAHPANWEYTQVVWMPIDCALQWDNESTIAATRALFRVMGWIDPT